jgi:hypothetical protein
MWTDRVNRKWPDLSAQVCNCFLSYFVLREVQGPIPASQAIAIVSKCEGDPQVIWMCFPVIWYSSECLQAVESSVNDLCDLLCCAEKYCNHSCHWVGMRSSTSWFVNVNYSSNTNRWDSDALVSASATAWSAVNLTRLFGNYLLVQGDIMCFVIQVFDDRSGSQTTASQSRNYEVNVSSLDTNVM